MNNRENNDGAEGGGGIPVIVYGAGGLGREVMQIALLTLCAGKTPRKYKALGYLDDGVEPGAIRSGYPVLGGGEYLENATDEAALVFGIADPEIKAKLYRKYRGNPNISFPNVIHPGASVSESASLGCGVVIASGCLISLDVTIGDCVFMNNCAMIGHDSKLGDFTSVMPLAAISGGVTIGERCLVGVQSAIRQGISVGNGATVGMGSIVMRDVPSGATALGNPAKRVR